MNRFSLENRFRRISLAQFKETGQRLETALRIVRPNLKNQLFLTTNFSDYRGFGSLTISTPESDATLDRREKHSLADLNHELWAKSFKLNLQLADDSADKPYSVFLSVEGREPRKLFFYAQCLDEVSQRVLS